MTKAPTVECEVVPRRRGYNQPELSWRFMCPYCKVYHTHGAMAGLRAAHCNYGSPYCETSYSLKLKGHRLVGVWGVDGVTTITRYYPEDDPIFNLDPIKRERKVIADVRRDLERAADRLVREPVTVRG